MNLIELRDAVHAALGFRSDIPTASPEQIIDAAKATAKRADDAEMKLARAHALLTERGSITDDAPLVERIAAVLDQRDDYRSQVVEAHTALDAMPSTVAPDCPTPADRIKYATTAWRSEREEASNLATLCQDAHDALTAAGVSSDGTPEERIRRLVDERERAFERRDAHAAGVDNAHEALDAAGVPNKVDGSRLTAVDRIRALAAERDEAARLAGSFDLNLHALRDALGLDARVPDAEVVRAAVGRLTEAKSAPEDVTLSAREVRALGLLYKSDRNADPRLVKQAIGVLLGVSNG